MTNLKGRAKEIGSNIEYVVSHSEEYNVIEKVEEILENALREAQEEMKARCIEALPLNREQLDKDDPDNYEACFAVHGWNDCLVKVHTALSALTIE